MPHYIIKVNHRGTPKYLIWSTIVDAPITYGMTREDFEQFYITEYGRRSSEDLPERLARCDEKGCSSFNETLGELISGNRAGDREGTLTLDEIIARYCDDR